MKRIYGILLFTFICNCSCAQPNCNRTVKYDFLKPKLDSSICIPRGYQIVRIYDGVDLNADNLFDKVIRWQKIKLSDGDTIFYSIYSGDIKNKFHFICKLKNLEPYFFYNYYTKSGNKDYDSIKSLYVYPTTAEVEFYSNSIQLLFYSDPATIKKLFFTYSREVRTWMLTREMQWFVPPKSYEGDEQLDEEGRKLEYDRAPQKPMRIDDFDMLKYVEW